MRYLPDPLFFGPPSNLLRHACHNLIPPKNELKFIFGPPNPNFRCQTGRLNSSKKKEKDVLANLFLYL